MSVEIQFEPDGPHGLIAEGTCLWDAARRLGFHIPADCEGRGECDTCAVAVSSGATLLSSLTDGERKQLSPERLAAGERLACQCKIEHGGELLVKLVPQTERAPTAEERARDLRKDFSALPFDRKIATLVQLETIAMAQMLNKISNSRFVFGGKVLDRLAGYGRKITQKTTGSQPRSDQADKK